MSAIILNGKALSLKIQNHLKTEVASLSHKPGLAVILVGDHPASYIYVNNKEKACQNVGFFSQKIILSAATQIQELLSVIDHLNTDPAIHGILCQFPLPQSLNRYKDEVIRRILPTKDVDGLHPLSPHISCTPKGIMTILKEYHVPIEGKHAIVLGRSELVGKPIAQLLLNENATVTITHSKTTNLPDLIRQGDIIIAAIGKPEYVRGEWLKDGAIVIDVGINRTENGLLGDVDFKGALTKASYITPVPGGIGPMTIAMLLENVLSAYNLKSPHPHDSKKL